MSRINNVAAARLSSADISGPKLLEMFKALEAQMASINSEMNYAQFQFVMDPNEMKEGDLIPEIHFSLRTYHGPIVGQPVEFEEGNQPSG